MQYRQRASLTAVGSREYGRSHPPRLAVTSLSPVLRPSPTCPCWPAFRDRRGAGLALGGPRADGGGLMLQQPLPAGSVDFGRIELLFLEGCDKSLDPFVALEQDIENLGAQRRPAALPAAEQLLGDSRTAEPA